MGGQSGPALIEQDNMDLGIKNRIALVTGASRGLGRATAAALAREGCRVALTARTEAEVHAAAEEIAAATGAETLGVAMDVARPDDQERMFETVRGRLGDPDILVTNAGGPPPGDFAGTALEDYVRAFELNCMSAVRLVHACAPAMKRKHWGRIVMITSIAVKQPIGNLLLSNVARSGLTAFMKTIATELAGEGITVNAVLPGIHDTDRVRKLLQSRVQAEGITEEQARAEMVGAIPAGRMGLPEEFGAVVAFLASNHAAFVTGTNLLVDGGAYRGLI